MFLKNEELSEYNIKLQFDLKGKLVFKHRDIGYKIRDDFLLGELIKTEKKLDVGLLVEKEKENILNDKSGSKIKGN